MRAVLQRVRWARVTIETPDEPGSGSVRQIAHGFLVLLGVGKDDTERHAEQIAGKISALRVFADQQGKMNRDLRQVGGAVMVVSQFTLYADVRRGRRPGFEQSAEPASARRLYQHFVQVLRQAGLAVETGEFGAHMLVELANDGPVTLLLDTDNLS